MIIEIGNRPLKDITQNDVLELAIIEGCCPSLVYWNRPNILDFDNTMFSETVTIDYESSKIENGATSDVFCFFFNFIKLSFHYSRNYKNNGIIIPTKNLSLESISYLIKQGYYIPFDKYL